LNDRILIDVMHPFSVDQYEQDDLVATVMKLRLKSTEEQIFVAYLKKSLHPAAKVCLMRYLSAHGRQSIAQERSTDTQLL
jgi:hypothetical protein